MKLTLLFVFALAGSMKMVDANCEALCTTKTHHQMRSACASKREMTPRPDAYNHCIKGFSAGAKKTCKNHCNNGSQNEVKLHRNQVCPRGSEAFKLNNCRFGFELGQKIAQESVSRFLEENPQEAPKKTQDDKQSIAQQAVDAAADLADVVPSARNLLEEARAEAMKAAKTDTEGTHSDL